MANLRKPREINRRIFFYRADTGADESGSPIPFDLTPTLIDVANVPFGSGSQRYWVQQDGDAIGLWTVEGFQDRFILAAVRRSSLPQSEYNGALTDLNLKAGAGLHEPVHVRLYPDNILGIEFNFYGPRPSRLPTYLKHVVPTSQEFVLEALLRNDARTQLSRFREIRFLELQIRPSYISQVNEASASLGSAFSALREVSSAEVLGLTLRPEPRRRVGLGNRVLTTIQNLAQGPYLAENVTTFKVKGVSSSSGKVEALNLLEDKLVSQQKVVTTGKHSRAVDPSSAFDAIDTAYAELEPQLLTAAGISVSTTNSDDSRGQVR